MDFSTRKRLWKKTVFPTGNGERRGATATSCDCFPRYRETNSRTWLTRLASKGRRILSRKCLKSGTDLWQVVDAGIAQLLKSFIGVEHRVWLDVENNAGRWFNHEKPFTAAERRILITHWAGEAWGKLLAPKYETFIRKCWQRTGCLMTADSSDDDLIKPEGLTGYVAPPPSILDPSPQPAMRNEPSAEVSADVYDLLSIRRQI